MIGFSFIYFYCDAVTKGAPYAGQQGYPGYGGPEQYGPPLPAGQYPPAQGQFPPPNRSMYPPYGPDGDA